MREWLRRLARDRFARRIKAAIERAGGPKDFVYDRESFMLKRDNNLANLGNVYDAYRLAKGSQRQVILDNFVSVFGSRANEESLSFAEAKDKLVAVVRERLLIANAQTHWTTEMDTPAKNTMAHDPVSEWFAKCVVVDFPSHVTFVTETQLAEWKLTFDEVFDLGLARLRECSAPKFRQEGRVFIGTWHDDYDSSRALLPELFADLPLDGDPVVALPNRLTLLVTGSSDMDGLKAMLAKAEQIMRSEAKPQNPAPLLLKDGQITDFYVEAASPVFNDVQRNHYLAALATYQEQKELLEKFYAKTGKDYFVASLILSQRDRGEYVSHAVWSRNVATLLPVADEVVFFDDQRPESQRIIGRVPWARVQAILVDLMLDTKMFPARFYVSKFPSAEQLKQLLA